MPPQAVNLDALAKQFGGVPLPPPAADSAGLDTLAQQFGGVKQQAQPDVRTDVNASDSPGWLSKAGSAVKDFGVGAGKGVLRSAVGAGRLMEALTPIERLTGGIPENAESTLGLDATNTAQKVGMGAEQIAEFFTPVGGVGKVKIAAEAAKSALLTAVQTGSPTQSAASAGISLALPAVGAAARHAAPILREGATKRVVQALGPTHERYKAMAERLAPEILKRGLGGSRASLQQKAIDTLETVGEQLDTALTTHAAEPVAVRSIVDTLETAKDAFRTTKNMGFQEAVDKGYILMKGSGVSLKAGTVLLPNNTVDVAVAIEPRALNQLSKIQKLIEDVGPVATVEQMVGIRRAWDKVVSQAGGYAHRAGGAIGVPLADQSEAFAKREGAGAIRRLLADDFPDMAAINKEYSFWKGLDDVLTQTMKRTQPQGKGLGRLAAEGAGQVVGGVVGSQAGPVGAVGGAILVGKLAEAVKAVFTSPRWRLMDAKLRNSLADALSTGEPGRIRIALARIATALPAQYRPAVAQ